GGRLVVRAQPRHAPASGGAAVRGGGALPWPRPTRPRVRWTWRAGSAGWPPALPDGWERRRLLRLGAIRYRAGPLPGPQPPRRPASARRPRPRPPPAGQLPAPECGPA